MIGSLVTLFVALLVGSFGVELIRRYTPEVVDSEAAAYVLSIAVSTAGIFFFIVSVYYLLTNERMRLRETLAGAAFATVLLQASFQVLPIFVRYANLNPALKTFGGPVILLVWLYVMANVLVFGAEINWWRHRQAEAAREQAAGLA
jgi:uncharacterized BrkB/YihY/UPF0761 family membrane protein